jgi:hypothetical protein
MRRAYTNSANQSQKMLASTVQFSTTNQKPPTHPRQTHALPQETQRYKNTMALPEINAHPLGAARSLRTQQRAYNPVLPTTPLHTQHLRRDPRPY